MQLNKNGIPLYNKKHEQKTAKPRNDFNYYVRFATMTKVVNGFRVVETVPVGHPDFEKLKRQGYKVVDEWEKGEIA